MFPKLGCALNFDSRSGSWVRQDAKADRDEQGGTCVEWTSDAGMHVSASSLGCPGYCVPWIVQVDCHV